MANLQTAPRKRGPMPRHGKRMTSKKGPHHPMLRETRPRPATGGLGGSRRILGTFVSNLLLVTPQVSTPVPRKRGRARCGRCGSN